MASPDKAIEQWLEAVHYSSTSSLTMKIARAILLTHFKSFGAGGLIHEGG
jgi:hypothetical protein